MSTATYKPNTAMSAYEYLIENSNLPLDKWLFAFYFIVTARKGVSSMQLSKELGVTQKTAWLLETKIRFAFGSGNHGFVLSGVVQIDETYVGGKVKNMHSSKKHTLYYNNYDNECNSKK